MKTYTFEGVTYTELPKKLKLANGDTVSPVTEFIFQSLGGVINDDGQPTPAEAFKAGIETYLETLEEQMADLGIVITVAEFKEAARTKMSTQLIEWAEDKHVPDDVIAVVRQKVLELIADGSRLGLTWNDLFAD